MTAGGSKYRNYVLALIGTGLMAFGIKCLYDPVNLVTGGFTGIAIIVKQITSPMFEGGVPLWLTNFFLNIPLFLFALKMKGFSFIKRSLAATVMLSAWLYVIPEFRYMSDDILLAALFGGIVSGTGIGLVFIGDATTGGTDMLAALIQSRFRHYSIAQIMQVIDAVIVITGAFIFGISRALYAIIAIYVVSRVSDGLMEGMKFSKMAIIITENGHKISEAVMKNFERGLTAVNARGMYTGNEKMMLYCVVGKKEIVHLKELITEVDREAFVIVTDAREVLGEGFLEYFKE